VPSKKHPPHASRGKRAADADAGEEAERPSGGARSQWSGTLSFGLVSIPVDLYPGTRASGVSLRLLADDGTPLARRFYCPDDGDPVPSEHLVRGYEYSPGQYVEISDEELEALQPEKSRDIDLRLFVDRDELDPAYFERAFFLAPSGDSTKAYRLLTRVMEDKGLAGIATFVMREREYLVAILAEGSLLRAQVLRFAGEVRSTDALELPDDERVPASEIERFAKAIRKQARDELDLDELHDDGAEAIRKLAEKKARNKNQLVQSPVAEEPSADAEIVDLMEVLQRSLAAGKDQAGSLKRSIKGKG
jgi:DNA end-binding protein Ku